MLSALTTVPLQVNKWHKGGKGQGAGGSGGAGEDGDEPRKEGESATARFITRMPQELRQALPNQEGFSPEAYLATFHQVR